MKRTKSPLRTALEKLKPGRNDFQIAGRVGGGFVAKTRRGGTAWLVPLDEPPNSPGRRAGGFVLASNARVAFEYEGRKWKSPAAVWESTEPKLLDSFLVLLEDAATRLGPEPSWPGIVAFVDEWQDLLARRAPLSAEQQLGLWGELFVIESAANPDLLVAAWLGPDAGAVDFFVDGIGLEVKTSRRRHSHHVSLSQVDEPVGAREAFTLSFWVSGDPIAGRSLVELVDSILSRVADKALFLKQLSKVGFSLADREAYEAARFVELEPALIVRSADVPRVENSNPAISQVRYVVALDQSAAVSASERARICGHLGVALQPDRLAGGETR